MKKNSKNKKGFSFVELMITIAIMAIMTTVTLVSMNKGRELWAVKTAAREVAATVRETQNYALTGKDLQGLTASCSFTFFWKNGEVNYGSADDGAITACKAQNYSLKNGVTFSSGGKFYFSVPFANLDISSTKDIILHKGDSDYYVCVYPSGIVKEDPVGC